MRIVYIKLKGYIGIYNGLGLNELEIDMSKAKHKVTVISGINGCGKSTLLKAMSILPDNSSDFTPGMPAEKNIRLLDNDNFYDITITSASAKTGRGVSKASIVKNGVELNPNGNISSYKDIIFQEFDLDSNFITLTKLSGDDRGLADKSPAERKKFMSFIVECLEAYNAIHKNLNKKSSIFKSYVNNLHLKIQNIGDENNMRVTLSSLSNRKNMIESTIERLKNSIVEAQTVLAINDPEGTLRIQYEEAEKELKDSDNKVSESFKAFSSLCRSIDVDASMDKVVSFLADKEQLIKTYEDNLQDSNRRKLLLIEKRESVVSEIDNSNRKIQELKSGIDEHLKSTLITIRNQVAAEKEILSDLGITDVMNTSKEELQYTFDTIKNIVNLIVDSLYYEANESMIRAVMSFSSNDLKNIEVEIDKQKELIESIKLEIMEAQMDSEILGVLSNRPKECRIDSCYFINSAYSLREKKYKNQSVEKRLNELAIRLTDATTCLSKLSDGYETMSIISQKKTTLDYIRMTITNNFDILKKCAVGRKLLDVFENRISNMQSFNDFKDLDNLIGEINTVTIYKQHLETLRSLENEWVKQSNSELLVEQLSGRLDELNKSLDDLTKQLSSLNNEIYNYTSLIGVLKNRYNIACEAKEKGDIWSSQSDRYNNAKRNFDDIIRKSTESISILEKINSTNTELLQYQSEIQPLESQIQKLSGQLIMLESYKEEYKMYSEKYNMIETLKKYSSPTSGIQTLFMSLYMDKTLELANKVLGMIFGGQYRLLDYIINSNEFRIPFVGAGMTVDDISSGSTSQICMMGMVMNLVLLYQASTRYNITRLDEIDGGLDTRNRLEFVNVLYKVIDILGIEQLFIISHSLELELSNVDVIKLKTYDEFNDVSEGNILYQFK